MLASLNKVILIATVSRDPEIKTSNKGFFGSLRVAIPTLKKNTTDGNYTDDWFWIKVFNKRAEFCDKYIRSGMQLYIEGRLSNRKYKDEYNNDRSVLEIIADNVQILGRKSDYENTAPEQQTYASTSKSRPPISDWPDHEVPSYR